jgi:kynurenine 3-monooxygenase
METPKDIIISGAGLAGSLLAISLKNRGHRVRVFEMRKDMREASLLAGKSINLILTRKGIEPLKKMGLLDTVLEITTPVYGRMMHSNTGELTYQPYGKDESEKNYSVPRGELNKLLMTEAEKVGAEFIFENGLKSIDIDSNTAHFTKGNTESFDHFFGADGSGSISRKELLKIDPSSKSELWPLGSHYKELSMPSTPDGNYRIDQKALHIWPRGEHMLMALPNHNGSFTMTIYMPEDWFTRFDTIEKVQHYFEEYYPDVIEHMPEFATEFLENNQGFLGSLEMNQWVFQDKLCLIGDAAHAIVPFFGQGMNCAFSDVDYLLNQLDENDDDWTKTFAAYQSHQKPNGDAIRDMSIENFKVMCESVADEQYLFKKKVEHIIENAMPHIYRSRYAKVVYTTLPYHIAKQRDEVESKIIDQLCNGLSKPEDVDLEQARNMLRDINQKLEA